MKDNYWRFLIQEIRKIRYLRIYITEGPGYGDQIATIHIVEKLKQAIKGLFFDIVYCDNEVLKIASLFSVVQRLKVNLPIFLGDMRLISLSQFVKNYSEQPVAAIALCGAGVGIKKDHVDFSNILKSRLFIYFNQFIENVQLLTTLHLTDSSSGYQIVGSIKKYLFDNNTAYALRYPVPTLKEALDFFKNIPNDTYNNALSYLIENIERNYIKSLPIYGLDPSFKSLKPLLVILNLLTGIRYAQSHDPKLRKPTVLLLMNEINSDVISSLQSFIANQTFPSWTQQGNDFDNLRFSLTRHNVSRNLIFLRPTDLHFIKQLSNLSPLDLIVIQLGKLPYKIFEALFSNPDSYPPLREGASSESLLYNAKKAFLFCDKSFPTPGRNYVHNEPNLRLISQINAIGAVICGQLTFWNQTNLPDQLIGQYFMDANNSSSSLYQLFHDEFHRYHLPQNDLVFSGLQKAIQLQRNISETQFNPQLIPNLFFQGSGEYSMCQEFLSKILPMPGNCDHKFRAAFICKSFGVSKNLLTNSTCALNTTTSLRMPNQPVIFFAAHPQLIETVLPFLDNTVCQQIAQHSYLDSWIKMLSHYGNSDQSICRIAEKCMITQHPAFEDFQCLSISSMETLSQKSGNLAIGFIHGFFMKKNQTKLFQVTENAFEYVFWLLYGYMTDTLGQQFVLANCGLIFNVFIKNNLVINILMSGLLAYRLYSNPGQTLSGLFISAVGVFTGWKAEEKAKKYLVQPFCSALTSAHTFFSRTFFRNNTINEEPSLNKLTKSL